MKKIVLLATIVMSLAACKKDASRVVVDAETLDGRSFHFMPIYEDGVTDITITIAWPMSWAHDLDRNPAVPYLAQEAILSGGTEELAPKDIVELFNDKNAQGRLYVRADHAIGELSFPKEHIEDVVSIASEMITKPNFNQAWINRIKKGLTANQTQHQAQTANQMWSVARLAILGEGPLYNFLSLPSVAAIEDVTIDDLHRWHAETIVQKTAAISVTGAINRGDAEALVDRLLAPLPIGSEHTVLEKQKNFAPRTVLLHRPNAEKTTLGLVGQLQPTSRPGDLVDLLAVNFFGRSGSGPLFEAVRTKLRASYGFEAGIANYDRATRFMLIAGEVETAKLAQAANLIRATYETYRTTPDFTGFENLRESMAEGTAKNVKYVDVVARTILEIALDGRDPKDAPHLGKQLTELTAKDVQERLASAFPAGDQLIIVAASPDASALPGACLITKIEQVTQCQ